MPEGITSRLSSQALFVYLHPLGFCGEKDRNVKMQINVIKI